ncbi:MAG: exosome complex component Rrp41 [Candidatus Micrarchaeota archaeon]|nr:MAG: exosome complex component Rrp41 [Candidatus Micrarchaeota archaeon]
MHNGSVELLKDGLRLDGRKPDELREISIKAGVIDNADGSAYLEWGNNRVLAAVYGPKEVIPKHDSDPNKAIVKALYTMSPFSSLEGHGRTTSRRAVEISKVTKEVFENVILTNKFPETEIDIYIQILQADGGTRAAGITAAAVALANAGIPMKDLVYGVSAGKVGDTVIIDLNMLEDNYSDADMPVVVSPRSKEILLLQMDGNLTKEEFKKAIDMILDAGKIISKKQREALIELYK